MNNGDSTNTQKTGGYPPGTTTGDLLNAQDDYGRPALVVAIIHNNFLPDTTVAHLRDCKDQQLTALHWCAHKGHYVSNTTTQDLIDAKDDNQRSALHVAAETGHLLSDTTIQHLIDCKDHDGRSALHACVEYHAKHNNTLPPGVTIKQLTNTMDKTGDSALCTALRNATKPLPGITAEMLQGNTIALLTAARFKTLPADTTVEQLTACVDKDGVSALHIAAKHGSLPKGTTAAQLAACVDKDGISALHTAAQYGHLPTGTTVRQLANTYDKYGLLPLHYAIRTENLPPNTDINDLYTIKNKDGESAWDYLRKTSELTVLQLAPQQLADHLDLVVSAVNSKRKTPKSHTISTDAIILGKVLAEPPTTPRSPETLATAWTILNDKMRSDEAFFLKLPPQLFQNDAKRAVALTNFIAEDQPDLAKTLTNNLDRAIPQLNRTEQQH